MELLSATDYSALTIRWREPHREYHSTQHLEECLSRFAELRTLAHDAAAVEAALWLHDAVLNPERNDNEVQSAALAREMLSARGVSAARIAHIEAMILATTHAAVSDDAAAQLVCDIDLAILGASATRFDEYERQVRAEYAFVPEPMFRVKRAEILARFLGRSQLYATAALRAALEATARENLARSLASLRAP